MSTILTVGTAPGDYASIALAVGNSNPGDTIDVMPGSYVNDFSIINHDLTIQAVNADGSVATQPVVSLTETHAPPNDKGMFTVGTMGDAPTVTISGIEVSGVTIPAKLGDNGAAVRWQSGNLTLNDDWFQNNQEGLLGTPLQHGTGNLLVENSQFNDNGSGNGQTHGLYVGYVNSLTIDNSLFYGTNVGHEIKSRADFNTIENSRIFTDGPNGAAGHDSMQIDLPNGGTDIVTNDMIEKGMGAENSRFIGFGEGPSLGVGTLWSGSSLSVTDDIFVNGYTHDPTAIWNASGLGDAAVTTADDGVWGMPLPSGSGWYELGTPPMLDYTHPWIGMTS
jgi:hypothetical protein